MSRLQNLKDVIKANWPELHIHPRIGSYAANKAGDVICIETLRTLKATPNYDGYVPYNLLCEDGSRVTMRGHRFVFECFNPEVDITNMHIDHDNQIRHDNRIANLQAMTPEEHFEKTMSQNPDMRGKILATMAKAVIKTEPSGEVTRYSSTKAAADANGLEVSKLKRLISKYQQTGPQWDYEIRPKDNEDFVKIPEEYVPEDWWPEGIKNLQGLEVSSLGRVLLRGERLVTGTESNNGIASATYQGSTFFIHQAVLFAFYGPPNRPGMVGRHISGDKSDNRWKNLRWEPRNIHAMSVKKVGSKDAAKQQACAIDCMCKQLRDRICEGVSVNALDTESGAVIPMKLVEDVHADLLSTWGEADKDAFIHHFTINNINNALIVVKKVMARVFGISCQRKSKRTDCIGFHSMILRRDHMSTDG